MFPLEDDEELGIGKNHIHEKCEEQIYAHDNRDRGEKGYPKYPEEEYIKRDNRERSEYCREVLHFEYREEVAKTIKHSLKGSMSFFLPIFPVGIHHLYHPSERYRLEEHIEDKYHSESYEYFTEIIFVRKVGKSCQDFILFMKYVDIRKCDLVNEKQKEPHHSKEGWKEIEFFEWVKLGDELPCGEDNAFFHNQVKWEKRVYSFFEWATISGSFKSLIIC